ncbi:MAG: DUF3784 domain-containing protein [Erysipelotrichaceae bacterium]|nr:DUF3784 domain-containing protein [Erysipelotrichaceae bacterium]
MTLKDVTHGPEIVFWISIIICLIFSIILLSGKGAVLIAGYNTSSKDKREKYDERKLSLVAGAGMSLITILLFVMKILENTLPASFATVSTVIIVIDCLIMVILMNTICKK